MSISRRLVIGTIWIVNIANIAVSQTGNTTNTTAPPPAVSDITGKITTLFAAIGWGAFSASLSYAAIKFMLGDRDAPERLRNAIIGGFLLGAGASIIKWLIGG